jgi:hypothetical protein
MFWRTNKHAQMLAAIARLERRVADIEDAVIVICNHGEALEEKPARIAHLLEKWMPDTTTRPM